MEKLAFDKLLENMQHFLSFPDVEADIDQRIAQRLREAQSAMPSKSGGDRVEMIADFLKEGEGGRNLRLLITLSGGSREILQLVVGCLFPGTSLKAVKTDDEVRQRVAEFLANPDQETSIPSLIRQCFALPDNWAERLQDGPYLEKDIRNTLSSQYTVSIGRKLEEEIASVIEGLGLDYKKGSVFAVDNKEVDLAIPNLESPQILIMSSYHLTTSSSQSERASAQQAMYDRLQTWNRSRSQSANPDGCKFINVIDGSGWIDRRKDLEHLWRNCDYCFTHQTLSKLREVVADIMGIP